MATILIVDDDPEVRGTVQRALSHIGYQTALAESPSAARQILVMNRPDLIVLDIMMPMQDGLSFCEELRLNAQFHTIPILFISARWRTEEVVRGLDAGGDDYLTKPFELKELNARVRALLRRSLPQPSATLIVGGITLDSSTFQVSTEQVRNIQLTSTEFRLLHYLMMLPNQTHSVRELLDKVWEYPPGSGDPDLVRAHIRNLRAKVEQVSSEPSYIRTIHGVGYMIKDE